MNNKQEYYHGFSGGELEDFSLIIEAKTPAEAAKKALMVRSMVHDLVEAGGVRAIDYESAATPRAENPGVPTTPRGLWAVELKVDLESFWDEVYATVGDMENAAEARKTWRVWCMYRHLEGKWTAGSLATVENISLEQVKYAVQQVDQAVWAVLERRNWRMV